MEKLLLPALHLGALLAFLTIKVKAPFSLFMRTRHEKVVEGLSRSKAQAKEAEAKKKEIDAKLSTIDLEKQKIVAEWKERELQQTRAIQEGSQKLLQSMKVEAERNRKALEETFRTDTVRSIGRMVLKQAQEKIMKGLTPEVHQRLNAQFASEVTSFKESVA